MTTRVLFPSTAAAFFLQQAKDATYTTVRGPFKMAPVPPSVLAIKGGEPHGCYFITYEVGAENPVHFDPSPRDDRAHQRCVLMLQNAEEGGVLHIESEYVRLGIGEGVIFRPDIQAHGVTKVVRGTRIVMTIGRLLPHD